jgi:hypothetical protein
MHHPTRATRPGVPLARVVLPLLLALATPTAAQESADGVDWDVQAELSGSFFFGNTEQTVFSTRAGAGRSDSVVALKSDVRFTYGETRDAEGEEVVTKRGWLATLSLDLQPYAWTSPFLIGTIESSLEKRIDMRYNAGLGNKVVVLRKPESEVSLSLALLGEWSRFADAPPTGMQESLVRWSARFRARHDVNSHLTLRTETYYRPEVRSAGRFTMTSTSSVGYKMRKWATLQLSFHDSYDSEARGRGARTNNDGQMVVGVMTAF